MLPIARDLTELGFSLWPRAARPRSCARTASKCDVVYKVNEGRPNVADEIVNKKIDLVVNTPLGRESFFDDLAVRRAAMMAEVPCITTLTGARRRGECDPRDAANRRRSARCRTTTPA
ncbi:MAG: hypothetical protein QM736_18635 [Vicinamibacterales bacterium]